MFCLVNNAKDGRLMENTSNLTRIARAAGLSNERDEILPAALLGAVTSPTIPRHSLGDQTSRPAADVQDQRKRAETLYRVALLVVDALMVGLAFRLAYELRFEVGLTIAPEVQPYWGQYTRLIALLIPLWLLLFWLLRLYDPRYLLGGTTEYTRALNASTNGMMAVVLVSFLVPNFQIARAWLVLSWILSGTLVCAGRLLLRRVAYRLRRRGLFVAPTLIVGTNDEALALVDQLRQSVASGLAVLGFVDTQESDEAQPEPEALLHGIPVLGDLAALPELVRTHGIQEVIVASTALSRPQLLELPEQLAAIHDVQVRLSSGLYEIFTTGMFVTTKNAVPLMNINRLRLDRTETILKTLLDYLLIGLALPFLLPFFAVIAALVKLDSPGPVFHRRRVVGIGGKEFDALKFRTMVVNGDEILAEHPELMAELQANFKLKNDPRVTTVGRFLRSTSLDELPQLINVLLGDMSLVGPRMIISAERAEYGKMQHNLFTVKPGLTGLWQVSGRSDLSYTERVQLDMHYIRNYSIWLDLQILFFQTLPAVLRRTGAY
jgi:exopolysaccharide biosynthesis polyprenyl glycosylphosphotransferase